MSVPLWVDYINIVGYIYKPAYLPFLPSFSFLTIYRHISDIENSCHYLTSMT